MKRLFLMAAKVAKPYQKAIEPCAGEPLLQVVVNPDAKASAKDIFADAWNAYRQMNGMEIISEIDFSLDPVFGQKMEDRETIVTNKGDGIVIETGQIYKGQVPMIKIVAVKDYGHWNFQPTARIMWEYFKQFRRDPETKKLIYCP